MGSLPRNGIILAGGRSRRFGSDKAMALLSGKPLITHAVELVRSVGLEACVITEGGRDYSFLNCEVYFDRHPNRGPLAGLERAFEIFPNEKMLVLTCDMPFLEKKDLEHLLEQGLAGASVVLYKLHPDRFQPFPGIYSGSLRHKIDLNNSTDSSMQTFLKKIDEILEINPGESTAHFSNVNTTHSLSKP